MSLIYISRCTIRHVKAASVDIIERYIKAVQSVTMNLQAIENELLQAENELDSRTYYYLDSGSPYLGQQFFLITDVDVASGINQRCTIRHVTEASINIPTYTRLLKKQYRPEEVEYFTQGDHVRILDPGSRYHGGKGTIITRVTGDEDFDVKLDDGPTVIAFTKMVTKRL